MRKIQYLILLIILFSCKKEDNIIFNQTTFTGTPKLIVQTEDLNIITCVGHGSLWNFNLIKSDTIGNKIWQKTIKDEDDIIRCIDVLESKNTIAAVSNSIYENPQEITFYFEILKD